jgi:hypothetical protein
MASKKATKRLKTGKKIQPTKPLVVAGRAVTHRPLAERLGY